MMSLDAKRQGLAWLLHSCPAEPGQPKQLRVIFQKTWRHASMITPDPSRLLDARLSYLGTVAVGNGMAHHCPVDVVPS